MPPGTSGGIVGGGTMGLTPDGLAGAGTGTGTGAGTAGCVTAGNCSRRREVPSSADTVRAMTTARIDFIVADSGGNWIGGEIQMG